MIKLTITALAFALAQPVQADDTFDINWASTVTDIKNSMTTAAQEASEKRLTYKAQLKGQTYHLEYLFADSGALANVLYYKSFSPEGSDCLSEYERMHGLYLAQLGTPKPAGPETPASHTLTTVDNACQAVAKGELNRTSKWSVDATTDMSVLLSTWKGQPYVGVSLVPAKRRES